MSGCEFPGSSRTGAGYGCDVSPGDAYVRTAAGREGLRAIRAAPGRALVALDFDGTLAPIVADPARARAHPGVPPALRRLAPRLAAVAIITGRPARTAVALGDLEAVPGLLVFGQYGRERWERGRLHTTPPPPGVAEAREALPRLLADAGAPPGTSVEDKGQALAVHTRRAADPAGTLELLRAPLTELADRCGLRVEPGRLVIELRPPGADKGAALRDLTARRGAKAVLYAGDDLGDMPAFETVTELRRGGIAGVTVCSASKERSELIEHADLVVDGPAGIARLLTWLADQTAR